MKILLSLIAILLGFNLIVILTPEKLDNTSSLLIGVSSSLIATGIFVIATDVFQRRILPWYGDKVYRGCRVDGEWTLSNGNNEQRLELTQFGDEVQGTYSHISEGEKDTYILKGNIKESFLSAMAYPKSQRHIDSIVFLLKVDICDGKYVMKGSYLSVGEGCDVAYQPDLRFVWQPT
ncbi:hypothetical protein [Photobacterium leiognathi]|uniref:hypothetical protein n=1 Tax=Photobacterium leiognathi TaxID=553611 RepID=UPI0029820516|nr:hypothetical protein [Photobacterium leiognathi]